MIRRVIHNTATGHLFVEVRTYQEWAAITEANIVDATVAQAMYVDTVEQQLGGYAMTSLGHISWQPSQGIAALNRELARLEGSGVGSNTDHAGAATDGA